MQKWTTKKDYVPMNSFGKFALALFEKTEHELRKLERQIRQQQAK